MSAFILFPLGLAGCLLAGFIGWQLYCASFLRSRLRFDQSSYTLGERIWGDFRLDATRALELGPVILMLRCELRARNMNNRTVRREVYSTRLVVADRFSMLAGDAFETRFNFDLPEPHHLNADALADLSRETGFDVADALITGGDVKMKWSIGVSTGVDRGPEIASGSRLSIRRLDARGSHAE